MANSREITLTTIILLWFLSNTQILLQCVVLFSEQRRFIMKKIPEEEIRCIFDDI